MGSGGRVAPIDGRRSPGDNIMQGSEIFSVDRKVLGNLSRRPFSRPIEMEAHVFAPFDSEAIVQERSGSTRPPCFRQACVAFDQPSPDGYTDAAAASAF